MTTLDIEFVTEDITAAHFSDGINFTQNYSKYHNGFPQFSAVILRLLLSFSDVGPSLEVVDYPGTPRIDNVSAGAATAVG